MYKEYMYTFLTNIQDAPEDWEKILGKKTGLNREKEKNVIN